MTIVFPRQMPDEGPGQQEFEPRALDFLNGSAGGLTGGVRVGDPLWTAVWDLARMGTLRAEEWRSWIETLDGPLRLFLGRDVHRPLPRHYATLAGLTRAGGGAWDADGTATAWSVNDARDELTLEGLPAAFRFLHGDYVGFAWDRDGDPDKGLTLARCVEPADADAGGEATFTVRPAIPAAVPAEAVAYLVKPACLMRLTPESRVTAMDRRMAVGAHLVAVQTLII